MIYYCLFCERSVSRGIVERDSPDSKRMTDKEERNANEHNDRFASCHGAGDT